jgi:type I restriction enzyme, S subunit
MNPKVRLGSIITKTVGGGTPERGNPKFWNGGIPWASVKDFKDGSYKLTKIQEEISEKGLKCSASHLIETGTPIVCTRMAVGRIALADHAVAINQDLRALYLSNEVDTTYVIFAIDLIRPQIENIAIGSTVKGISLDQLLDFKIFIPTAKPEQTKIAEVLSTVDRAIEQTEALIAKQQRIKTGLMQDLLTRGIDEHGNLRAEQPHKFKDSPLGRIPLEWEVKTIEELLADVNPSMRSGPFGSALLKEELVEEGIPLLGIDNVFAEKFVPQFTRFVHPKKANTLKRYRVRPGDLMVTIMGTVGRCCVVPDNIGFALSSKHTWSISLNQNIYSPYLACLQINYASWVLRHFTNDEQGGIMSSIKSDTIRTTRLPIPQPEEINQIEIRLKAISLEIETKYLLLNKLRALKTALMQDLLTGKKRVTPVVRVSQNKRSSRRIARGWNARARYKIRRLPAFPESREAGSLLQLRAPHG